MLVSYFTHIDQVRGGASDLYTHVKAKGCLGREVNQPCFNGRSQVVVYASIKLYVMAIAFTFE